MFCPTYSLDLGPTLDERPIRYPMDIISREDCDTCFLDVFKWLQNLSAARMSDGQLLYDRKVRGIDVPFIWASWGEAFFTHLHLIYRFINSVRAALVKERPLFYMVVGTHHAFPWKAPLIEKTVLVQFSHISPIPPIIHKPTEKVLTWDLNLLKPDADFRGAEPETVLKPDPDLLTVEPESVYDQGLFFDQSSTEVQTRGTENTTIEKRADRDFLITKKGYHIAFHTHALNSQEGSTIELSPRLSGCKNNHACFGICDGNYSETVHLTNGRVWLESKSRSLRLNTKKEHKYQLVLKGGGSALIVDGKVRLTSDSPLRSGQREIFWGHPKIDINNCSRSSFWSSINWKSAREESMDALVSAGPGFLPSINHSATFQMDRLTHSVKLMNRWLSGFRILLLINRLIELIKSAIHRLVVLYIVNPLIKLKKTIRRLVGSRIFRFLNRLTGFVRSLIPQQAGSRTSKSNFFFRWLGRLTDFEKSAIFRLVRPRIVYMSSRLTFVKNERIRRLAGLSWRDDLKSTEFAGHAAVIVSGMGSKWFYSRKLGHWILVDEYVEGLTEALIERCRRNGWRLSIIYTGSMPDNSEERKAYSQLYPEFIREYATHDLERFCLIEDHRAALGLEIDELLEDQLFRILFSFKGVTFADLLSPVLKKIYVSHINSYLIGHRIWNEALSLLKPDILWGGRLEGMSYVNLAARKCGTMTTGVQLGIGEEMLITMFKVRPNGTQAKEYYCDLLSLWGERQKKFFHETAPEYTGEVRAIGRTRLDTFVREAPSVLAERDKIRSLLGLGRDDLVIMFGPTIQTRYGEFSREGACIVSPWTYRRCLEEIAMMCREDRRIKVMIKPWAGDNLEFIRSVIQAFPEDQFFLRTNRDTGLHNIEFLAASDVVMCNVSSLFSEAVAMDVPAVNLVLPEVFYLHGTQRLEQYNTISMPVYKPEDIPPFLRRVFFEPDFRKEHCRRVRENIRNIFGELDGRIAERVIYAGFGYFENRFKKHKGTFPKGISNRKGMKNIALIGAGQLGSRHLQALAKIDLPVFLQVVDPDPSALRTVQQRYLDVPLNPKVRCATFTVRPEILEPVLDLCVVATNSDVRLQVLRDLLSTRKVNNLLLEKVVFQSAKDFREAKSLLEDHNVKCWVNCPLRMYDFYRNLKKYFPSDDPLNCEVRGGDWGLGCNAIHYIDLLAYYAEDSYCEVDSGGLDLCIHQSKRSGFIEFTGMLKVVFSGGARLNLVSIAASDEPKIMTLESSRAKVVIDPIKGVAKLSTGKGKSKVQEIQFCVPYQSELTHLAATEIIEKGSCQLTRFDESAALHIPLLRALSKHVEKVEGRICERCPIT